jgi:hypothetical protein
MRKASDYHLNDIAVCSDPDSGTPKKKPRFVGGAKVRLRRGFLGGEFPAPRARPQIASVELVPWSVRLRTMTVPLPKKKMPGRSAPQSRGSNRQLFAATAGWCQSSHCD